MVKPDGEVRSGLQLIVAQTKRNSARTVLVNSLLRSELDACTGALLPGYVSDKPPVGWRRR